MTGVGCHFLLQGIFPTQWSNLHLLHWQWILYHLSHQENSPSYECVTYFTPEGLRRNILSIVEISKPRFCGFCWFVFWSTELYSLRFQFSSVQFSRSFVSDSLRPHELQHARPPCPSPTPGVHSDSRPSSQWCHPAISSSVIPFSPAPNPSQHQSLFQWVNSLHEVAKVLEFQL